MLLYREIRVVRERETLSDNISTDRRAENLACCRKCFPPKILSAENFVRWGNVNVCFCTEKSVKRVVYADGGEQNLGCTRHTGQCAKGPHYDYDRHLRINLPPCCMNHTLGIVKTVTHDFNTHKIAHVIIGGAVLGWARNK